MQVLAAPGRRASRRGAWHSGQGKASGSWNRICLCLEKGCELSLQTEAQRFLRAFTQPACKCHCPPQLTTCSSFSPYFTEGLQGPYLLRCVEVGTGGTRWMATGVGSVIPTGGVPADTSGDPGGRPGSTTSCGWPQAYLISSGPFHERGAALLTAGRGPSPPPGVSGPVSWGPFTHACSPQARQLSSVPSSARPPHPSQEALGQ